MRDQLASELAKIWSVRTWWVLGAILVIGSASICALLAQVTASSPDGLVAGGGADAVRVLYNLPVVVGYAVPVIFGVLTITGEHHDSTLTTTLLVEPRRGVVLAAKFVVSLIFCAGYAAAAVLACTVTAALIIGGHGGATYLRSPETWRGLLAAMGVLVLWGLLGVGVGTIVRNQLAAVVGVLCFTQFVEPLLRVFLTGTAARVARFLPGSAADEAVNGSLLSAAMARSPGSSAWGFAVLAGYAVVAGLVGWRLFRTRPVT